MGRAVIRYIDITYSSTLALYSIQHTNPMSCSLLSPMLYWTKFNGSFRVLRMKASSTVYAVVVSTI